MKNLTRSLTFGIFNFVLAMLLLTVAGVSPLLAIPISTVIAIGAEFCPPLPMGLRMGFITNGSEYNGRENTDIMIRPIFTGQDVKALGLRVVFTDKSGSVKMTFFSALEKIVKKYADGFQGGLLARKKQKKFAVNEFKAEAQYSKQDYKDTILELITNRAGISQNDIDGTIVLEAERAIFGAAIKADTLRLFWLADTTKKYVQDGLRYDSSADVVIAIDATTGVITYTSGGADIYYNSMDGLWKKLMADTIATANTVRTEDKIQRIFVANGTVAQVTTATLTGTSGTANLILNGVSYLATFNTTLTQTATDFRTTYLAALTALGITVTTSTADVIFTSAVLGQPFSDVTVGALTGNLGATVVATTANTPAANLGVDEAHGYMKDMVNKAPKVLKRFVSGTGTQFEGADQTGVKAAQGISMPTDLSLRFYCTDSWIENYRDTLMNDATLAAHVEVIDGIKRLTFFGIPLIPMGIDGYLATDFVSPYPHRCILTSPENLVLVLNAESDFAETRFWYEPNLNLNRQRAQFEYGADYMLPELVVVAY